MHSTTRSGAWPAIPRAMRPCLARRPQWDKRQERCGDGCRHAQRHWTPGPTRACEKDASARDQHRSDGYDHHVQREPVGVAHGLVLRMEGHAAIAIAGADHGRQIDEEGNKHCRARQQRTDYCRPETSVPPRRLPSTARVRIHGRTAPRGRNNRFDWTLVGGTCQYIQRGAANGHGARTDVRATRGRNPTESACTTSATARMLCLLGRDAELGHASARTASCAPSSSVWHVVDGRS